MSGNSSADRPVASLRRNVVANLAGKAWMAGISLVFLPLYVHELGIESYALVAFYASMAAVLGVLDIGLIATVDREIARLPVDASVEAVKATRDLVRTFELLFWGVGAAVGALTMLLAPVIATRWLNAQDLPAGVITNSIRVMGLIFAFQWPFGIYLGGLVGLQRQVEANIINVVATTVKFGGAAILVLWISPSIEAFFAWQLVTTVLQTLAARVLLMRALPHGEIAGVFAWRVITANWRFSLGMSAISVLGIVLIQGDRMLMSRFLSLEDFGYYSLANTVGRSLTYLVGPVFTAVYPRMCQLVAAKDEAGTRSLYHTGSQVMSVAIIPTAVVLTLFSREVLLAWTQDASLVERTWLVVIAITVGTACHALAHVPFGLQLADGWTSLSVWMNSITVVILVPTLVFTSTHYGMLGAAGGWTVLSLGGLVIGVHAMHRRLLRGEEMRWYRDSIVKPMLGACAAALPFRLLWPEALGRVETIVGLAIAGIVTMTCAALATPLVRDRVLEMVQRRTRLGDA